MLFSMCHRICFVISQNLFETGCFVLQYCVTILVSDPRVNFSLNANVITGINNGELSGILLNYTHQFCIILIPLYDIITA
jgi:hypothetical protein